MKRYNVEINGVPTVLLLDDDDAKDRGLKASDELKPDKPDTEAKARTPANKARTPAQKRADTAAKGWGAKGK
jgi:hypothetical protein